MIEKQIQPTRKQQRNQRNKQTFRTAQTGFSSRGKALGPEPGRESAIASLFRVLVVAFTVCGSQLAAEEVGPNDLRISFGLGPGSYSSQLEPRLQNEFAFGGAYAGGFGQMPPWNYSSESGQILRIAYFRNRWLFQLDQRSDFAASDYTSSIQGNFNNASVTRFSNHTGELTQYRTGLLAGLDLLHENETMSFYLLFGFRSITEEYLNERTSITQFSVSGSSVTVAGASPLNRTFANAGTLYLGLDFLYRFQGPMALQFRLGLEAGGGDWEETDVLFSSNNAFEFRKEIGSSTVSGIEMDVTFHHEINQDWSFFATYRRHRVSLTTREVIPLLANSTPPTNEAILQDLVLTYGGAQHRGVSSALLFGFTYSYRFW